jgi:[ribosomal protein S18]-alanine N-acetyltransferase
MADMDAQVSTRPWTQSQYLRFCHGAAQASLPGSSLPEGECHRQGNSGDSGLVAEQAGQICGFVIFTRVLDVADINNIVVAPTARGRGVGRKLLETALQSMRVQGVAKCQLEVRQSNAPALALYRAEGFGKDGERPGYYTTGSGGREGALLMSKKL